MIGSAYTMSLAPKMEQDESRLIITKKFEFSSFIHTFSVMTSPDVLSDCRLNTCTWNHILCVSFADSPYCQQNPTRYNCLHG